MSRIHFFLKKHLPKVYNSVRLVLFPYVNAVRLKKGAQFTAVISKQVSILGYKYSIIIDPSNGFIDTQIFTTGGYEIDILQVMQKHLAPGDVFVDIGGNIGWHTLFAAQIVGENGHVYTFEPINKLINQLTQSIEKNNFQDRITLFPFGCSDTEKNIALNINPINIGGSSVFNLKTKSNNSELITLKRADSILSNIVTKVSMIKIDTEGSELEALIGLGNILNKFKPKLIIEFSPSFWGDGAQEKCVQFFKILTDNNYVIFDLESGHTEITPSSEWIANFKKLQTNFLCLHKT